MTQAARHARMLLPYTPPPLAAEGGRLPPPPSLWRRAQDFLTSLAAHIAAFTALAPNATQQRDLLGRLEPIEKLVRALLILRALTFLLATPQGRRLMRETLKSPLPQKPVPPAASSHCITIPSPGWSTIAQHHGSIPAEMHPATNDNDATRSAPFRICTWRFPKNADTPPQAAIAKLASKAPRLATLDIADPNPRATPESSTLARRIATLTRIMANPARPAARLARWFAGLPREALQGLTETFVRVRAYWNTAIEEACAAAAHVRRAACVLLHPEPG